MGNTQQKVLTMECLCRGLQAEAGGLVRLQMEDIERMRLRFLRKRINPGVSYSDFDSIFNVLSLRQRRETFSVFGVQEKVDVNEVFAVAIILSAAFLSRKRRALFDVYDSDGSGALTYGETVIMVGSCLRGLCRVTASSLPSMAFVEALCADLFSKVDSDGDRRVTVEEWLAATRNHPTARYVLERFQKNLVFVKQEQLLLLCDNDKKKKDNVCLKISVVSSEAAAKNRRSLLAAHPQLVRELKKELKALRDVFDAIDEDGSGEIALSEFVEAKNKKSDSPRSFQANVFEKTDLNGDGKLSWEELLGAMYQKYGKAAIDEMVHWDLSGEKKTLLHTKKKKNFSVRLPDSQIDDIKLMFDLYDVDKEGTMSIDDLAATMSDFHGLNQDDLLAVLETAGKHREDFIDAEGYVDIFRNLITGDGKLIYFSSFHFFSHRRHHRHSTKNQPRLLRRP